MNKKRVMVCVTRQKNCERLIHHGYTFARTSNLDLCVVHAVHCDSSILGTQDEAYALEYLFSICRQCGANMTMVRSEDSLQALVTFAKKNNVGTMILGASPQKANSIVDRIRALLPQINLVVLESQFDIDEMQSPVA